MKRIIVITLALLMVLSLAACGGKTETNDPETTAAEDVTEATQTEPADASPDETESESAAEAAAPVEAALIPGELFQLGEDAAVVRGLSLAGNRSGSSEFNSAEPAAADIRCIFELSEWVEVTPDTDAQDGLAVWVFGHRDDPKTYADEALSEESEGYAAYCELPFDPEAEAGASRGSFYLNPDDCEPGYYDLVFTLDGQATAVLLTRFYNEAELESKTDAELAEITAGLKK